MPMDAKFYRVSITAVNRDSKRRVQEVVGDHYAHSTREAIAVVRVLHKQAINSRYQAKGRRFTAEILDAAGSVWQADNKDRVCCSVCGSLDVQYAIWFSPNTGETGDCFGSWNAGDNTFCSDCDAEDRDANPDLLDAGAEPEAFKKARAKYERTHHVAENAINAKAEKLALAQFEEK